MKTVRRLVGQVVWGDGGASAALYDDGRWDVSIDGKTDAAATRIIAARYGDAYAGPQDGRFGVKILNELAASVNGTVVLEDAEPTRPGIIY